MRRRLTYANVVATLALMLALGGGSVYAASKISGKTIKKGTLPGNRIKPGSVTGAQVDESSLGSVPNAKSAERAQNALRADLAQNANLLGGKSASDLQAAYATVTPPCGPSCTITQSRGVTTAERESAGRFCVVAPGFDGLTASAAVSVQLDGTPDAGNATAISNEDGTCGPNDTGFVVVTQRQPIVAVRNAADTGSENVAGPAVLADDVSFTIVIPR